MSLLTRSSTVDGVLRRSAARYSDTTALIFGERTLRCRPRGSRSGADPWFTPAELQPLQQVERADDATGVVAEVDGDRRALLADHPPETVRLVRDPVVNLELLDLRLDSWLEGTGLQMSAG